MNRRDFLSGAAALSVAALPKLISTSEQDVWIPMSFKPIKEFRLECGGKSMTWTEGDLATLNEYRFAEFSNTWRFDNCTWHNRRAGLKRRVFFNFAGTLARQAHNMFLDGKQKVDVVLFEGKRWLLYQAYSLRSCYQLRLIEQSPFVLNQTLTLAYDGQEISWSEEQLRSSKIKLVVTELQDYSYYVISFREELADKVKRMFKNFSCRKVTTFNGKKCELIYEFGNFQTINIVQRKQ